MFRIGVIAVLACLLASTYVEGFSFSLNNQCDSRGSQGSPTGCYATCPSGTTQLQYACPTGGEVCCQGTPQCQSVNCNNGTCVTTGGVESCVCDDGFNGTFCEFDLCDSMNTTCGNETQTCNRLPLPELFNCTCNDGWSGPTCEVDECANLGCVNGTCNPLPSPNFAECLCDDGFSGVICDVDACDPDPCINGNCTREAGGNYTCQCDVPFFGNNCTDEICDSVPCQNGGTCTSYNETDYTCECPDEWTDLNCSTQVCAGDDSECSFNGTCVPIGGGNFECNCVLGYTGDICEIPELACGIEQMTRIVGDNFDQPGGNPWTVILGKDNATFCSGVLIANQYVLTDILCGRMINQSGILAEVLVGVYNVSEPGDTMVTFGIEEIITNNAPYATFNDALGALSGSLDALLPYIAIVKLNDTINRGYGVNAACPPKSFDSFCNATCKMAAYGTVADAPGSNYAAYRQSVDFALVNDAVCGAFRGSAFPVSSGCGVSLVDGTGMCQGDFGGSVVCQDPVTSQWHLQGIIQFRTDPANGQVFCSNQIVYYADMNEFWPFVDGIVNA